MFFHIVITPDLWAFLGSPPPLWQWASERMVPVKCRWIQISLKTLLWMETGETSLWCCLESLAPPGTRNNEKTFIVTRVLAQLIFYCSCCSWFQDSFFDCLIKDNFLTDEIYIFRAENNQSNLCLLCLKINLWWKACETPMNLL